MRKEDNIEDWSKEVEFIETHMKGHEQNQFTKSHYSFIKSNTGNKTYKPYLERLIKYYENQTKKNPNH